jgi:hypothetical protein
MRFRRIILALATAASIAAALGVAAPAQAADATVYGPTFSVQGASCQNSVHMYTLGSEVVATSTIVCSKRFPTIVSEINLSRNGTGTGNQRLCTGNPTGCSSSVRIGNPGGAQTFGAHANCILDAAGVCRFGWGANVSFRA